MTNLQEWLCGTDPVDAASYLQVSQVTRDGASVRIKFFAVAGKTYSIVYRDSVTGGPWFKLPDVVAPLTGGEQTVIDSTIGATMLRVYRLVTPMLP